jgi:UDP-4-amino-4,6-dideoxy-N-acetyl-beta-L-altrosamine transaminase
MIPYGKQTIDRGDIALMRKVLSSDFITQGPMVGRFEKALAEYCGAKYAVAVSSGTAALHIACLAAGLEKGDQAITTPITFAATANAVLYAGARPLFADVSPDTSNIDPEQIICKITRKTKAILPVHYAGLPCDMQRISEIALKHRLIVIEDACHALGAAYKDGNEWVKVGSCRHSDMAVFSFHPVKSITTGEGGAVLTNDKGLVTRLQRLRSHGITKDPRSFVGARSKKAGPWYYEMQELGFNYRITDFQCALGLSQLDSLSLFVAKRQALAGSYERAFIGSPYFDYIPLPFGYQSARHLFVIRLADVCLPYKREIVMRMLKRGVGTQVHYLPVYLHPFYARLGYRKGACPAAENFYARAITIPIFPSLTFAQQRRCITALLEAAADVVRQPRDRRGRNHD